MIYVFYRQAFPDPKHRGIDRETKLTQLMKISLVISVLHISQLQIELIYLVLYCRRIL